VLYEVALRRARLVLELVTVVAASMRPSDPGQLSLLSSVGREMSGDRVKWTGELVVPAGKTVCVIGR